VSGGSPIERLRCFQERKLLWPAIRPRPALRERLLFVYKEYLFDHGMYSMAIFLKRHFRNVSFLSFSGHERPRENPALGTPKLLRAVERIKPGVIFNYGSMLTMDEAMQLTQQGIRLAAFPNGVHSFHCGGTPTQAEALELLRRHSWYLISHAPHVARLKQEGINAIEFPFWFDADWFRPLKMQKEFDILFVGDLESPLNRNRREMLLPLTKRFKVAIASAQGPTMDRILYLGHTNDPRQLNVWLNQARIVVGSDRLAARDALNTVPGQFIFYTDEYFIRQRVYLTLGAGACYLTERHPEIERKFEHDREIVLWNDADDFSRQVERYLTDDVARHQISERARARAVAEHSTPVRCGRLARQLDIGPSKSLA
jgi:hypothetical protein